MSVHNFKPVGNTGYFTYSRKPTLQRRWGIQDPDGNRVHNGFRVIYFQTREEAENYVVSELIEKSDYSPSLVA